MLPFSGWYLGGDKALGYLQEKQDVPQGSGFGPTDSLHKWYVRTLECCRPTLATSRHTWHRALEKCATEELTFRLYLTLTHQNVKLNTHMWLVATELDGATLKIHKAELSKGIHGWQSFRTDITHNLPRM